MAQARESLTYRYNRPLLISVFGICGGGGIVVASMYRFITEGGVDSSLYLLLLALAGLGGFIYKFLVTEIVLEQKALHYSSLWIEKRIRYQEIQKITIGSSPFASVDIYAKNRLWADVTVGGGVTDWPRFAYHLLGRVPSSTEVSGGEWIIEADSVDDLPGNRSK